MYPSHPPRNRPPNAHNTRPQTRPRRRPPPPSSLTPQPVIIATHDFFRPRPRLDARATLWTPNTITTTYTTYHPVNELNRHYISSYNTRVPDIGEDNYGRLTPPCEEPEYEQEGSNSESSGLGSSSRSRSSEGSNFVRSPAVGPQTRRESEMVADGTMTESEMVAEKARRATQETKRALLQARIARMTGILDGWEERWEAASRAPAPADEADEEAGECSEKMKGIYVKDMPNTVENKLEDGNRRELGKGRLDDNNKGKGNDKLALSAVSDCAERLGGLAVSGAPVITTLVEESKADSEAEIKSQADNAHYTEKGQKKDKMKDNNKLAPPTSTTGRINNADRPALSVIPEITTNSAKNQPGGQGRVAPPTASNTGRVSPPHGGSGVALPEEIIRQRDTAEVQLLQLRAKIPWLMEQRGIEGAGWRMFGEYYWGGGGEET